MSKPYEVHVRGRRTITCATREEADDWAAVLSTTTAPATVREAPKKPATPPGPEHRQQTIFDSLEGTA